MKPFRILMALFVCALVALSIEVTAQQVSKSIAQDIASKFMQEHKMGSVDASKTILAPRSAINASQDEAAFYVFNAQQNKGFVIVSGDARTEKVLGYCDHGTFDFENMPDVVKCWLDQYVAQINQCDYGTAPSTKAGGNIIHPFIKTRWGQDLPFNLKCPKLNGEYCLAGSTATAMAQVMYYYRWPSTQTTVPAYHTATHNIQCNYYYGASNDWDNMQVFYPYKSGSENDPSHVAVANLMRFCAQAFWTDFDPSYTPASDYVESIVFWLRFSQKARQVWRCDYTQSEWENFILTELQARRPVLYTAESHTDNTSHTFICDGYDGNGYYHFNWGNRGLYDGYYKLGALNPSINDMPYDYSLQFSQRIIIGLEPNNVATDEKNCVAEVTNVSFDNNTYIRQSNGRFVINTRAIVKNNHPSLSKTYDIGWEVFKADGHTHVTHYPNLVSNTTLSYNQSITISHNLSFGYGYANGTYILRPICRETGNEKWYVCHKSGYNYIRADIKDDTVKLSRLYPGRSDGVDAEIMYYSSVKRVGAILDVYIRVTNNERIEGEIPLYLWAPATASDGGGMKLMGGTTAHIPRGSSDMAIISFLPERSGSYDIYISSRNDEFHYNEPYTYYCKKGVQVENYNPSILEVSNTVVGADANRLVRGNTITLRSTMTNVYSWDYHNYVLAELFQFSNYHNDNYYLVRKLKKVMDLYGEGGTGNIDFVFEDLEPGWYWAKVYYYSGTYTYYGAGIYPHRLGNPCDVNCDGAVNAADITALYDYLLNGNATHFDTSDVNFDDAINSADVTAIYDTMLGNN